MDIRMNLLIFIPIALCLLLIIIFDYEEGEGSREGGLSAPFEVRLHGAASLAHQQLPGVRQGGLRAGRGGQLPLLRKTSHPARWTLPRRQLAALPLTQQGRAGEGCSRAIKGHPAQEQISRTR
jgi:hypothetical protein